MILNKLKQALSNACIYFTAAQFLLLMLASAFSSIDPQSGGTVGMYLKLSSAALIFAACLIMAALNFVFELDYSLSVRLLFHFLGSLAAYTVVFIIIPGAWQDFAAILVRLAVFAGLYLLIALLVLLVDSILKNRRTDSFEYDEQFSRRK